MENRRTQVLVVAGFIIVVLAIALYAGISSQGVQSAGSTFNATTAAAITSDDHTKGPANATVTLIEYGDFQCPACGAYEPLVEQLEATYNGRVEFVFRNFPLTQIHQDAMISAEAAEAANLQGKYWEMHDLLYKNQSTWSAVSADQVVSKYFNGYAQTLGLNVAKFDSDIASSAIQARVQRDIDSGNAAQIDHTPTFFLNLTQIQNPTSIQQFESVLDTALGTSSNSTATSTQ